MTDDRLKATVRQAVAELLEGNPRDRVGRLTRPPPPELESRGHVTPRPVPAPTEEPAVDSARTPPRPPARPGSASASTPEEGDSR
jgi:hypothetical protein